MRRPRLLWTLSASYLGIAVLCTLVLGWYAVDTASDLYVESLTDDLVARARLVDRQLEAPLEDYRPYDLAALLQGFASASGADYVVIAPDGEVVAASDGAGVTAGRRLARPEVVAALDGRTGSQVDEGPDGVERLSVAVPLEYQGSVSGALRVTQSLTNLNAALGTLYRRIIITAAIIAAAAGGVGIFVAGRISRRMKDLREGAERFASGDFSYTIEGSRTEEFGAVATSLNSMARRLDQTIRTITEQSNEREAILTSMLEGVLAVDLDEKVITINDAAASLLGLEAEVVQGRTIQEAVRNPRLQQLVAEALVEQAPVEGEILLRTPQGDRFLQVNGTGLRDASGMPIGAIAVLNDVTRLKSLEEMRREFVANVSHEIKTPVTAIKGFAETLLDGALEEPADARRFARIIVGQADRLNSIVEDLLALSTVESLDEGGVDLEEANVTDVVQVAAEVCASKAEKKGIRLEVDADDEVYARISPPLLEQAVVNLVDNAIKYSPDGGTVAVALTRSDDGLVIAVTDHGCGIAREHLPHLFRRFYRVDKARSRELGGTGLGLAIVKHIASVHGGSVSVTSTLGAGSTFRIHLPHG